PAGSRPSGIRPRRSRRRYSLPPSVLAEIRAESPWAIRRQGIRLRASPTAAPRPKRPRGRAAKQRNELAPFHRQFLPCFEAEDSIAGDLPHCGISAPSMTALGHQRPVATPAAVAPCPLYPKSGQTADSLGMSA